MIEAYRSTLCQSIFEAFQVSELDISETFWFVVSVFDNFDGLCLLIRGIPIAAYEEQVYADGRTCGDPKNSSSSVSVRSKARLPM